MELEGALEIIRGLTIASFLLMRKPGLRKMGWLFQDLQLAALPGSDVSIGKLMSVIHSLFIYPLVIYAQCFFYRMSGRRVKPWVLGCGFCKQI